MEDPSSSMSKPTLELSLEEKTKIENDNLRAILKERLRPGETLKFELYSNPGVDYEIKEISEDHLVVLHKLGEENYETIILGWSNIKSVTRYGGLIPGREVKEFLVWDRAKVDLIKAKADEKESQVQKVGKLERLKEVIEKLNIRPGDGIKVRLVGSTGWGYNFERFLEVQGDKILCYSDSFYRPERGSGDNMGDTELISIEDIDLDRLEKTDDSPLSQETIERRHLQRFFEDKQE